MIYIQWQNHQGVWVHYSSTHNEPTAYRMATARAERIKKRHRLLDANKKVIDIVEY